MKKEVISYLFFGVLTTLINFISYWFLTDILGVHYTVSTAVSWLGAVLFAFVTNKLYVFKTAGTLKETLKELYSFTILRALSLGLDLGLMVVLVSLFHVNDLYSKIAVNVLIVIVNYVLSKFIIFAKSSTAALEESND